MYWKVYETLTADNLTALCKRPDFNLSDIKETVETIIKNVKKDKDEALISYAKQFDNTDLKDNFYVSEEEFKEAENSVDEALKVAIEEAYSNIYAFHKAQLPKGERVETLAGCNCWRKIVPINSVGLYIPGGTAPLFSTILMLAIPAKIAQCKEIILATPAKNNKIAPSILYAAKRAGVNKVLKCGGSQAIAALSFGTESVKKVDKIFGPGNRFVALAKSLVSDHTAIDMIAGPSEVMVVADKSANPMFVATDLLSQAEHGKDSQVVLVVKAETKEEGKAILANVDDALAKALSALDRQEFVIPSLTSSSAIIVKNNTEALEVINSYAPEHLILNTIDCDILLEGVENAGSVFLGQYSPEAAGDYASGTNHTLPTSGWANSCSGVSLDSFIKKITCQRLSLKAAQALSSTVITMAKAEGLSSHALAMKVRVNE